MNLRKMSSEKHMERNERVKLQTADEWIEEYSSGIVAPYVTKPLSESPSILTLKYDHHRTARAKSNSVILSFVDATYNYTGNFNWQRGSEALANVFSEEGIPLGIVNTLQNNNIKNLTAAFSFAKLYSVLGLKSSKNPFNSRTQAARKPNDTLAKKNPLLKKSLTSLVDVLTLIKRVQMSYSENNGSVLPGY